MTADTEEMDGRATATLHLYKRGPRTDTVEKLRQKTQAENLRFWT